MTKVIWQASCAHKASEQKLTYQKAGVFELHADIIGVDAALLLDHNGI